MSMEDYGRGYDEGYSAGYDLATDREYDNGYAAGYNDCMTDRRENWINHEMRIIGEIRSKFCETDEDCEVFDKLWRDGEFHVDPPHLIGSKFMKTGRYKVNRITIQEV